jgi:hypothetical protein
LCRGCFDWIRRRDLAWCHGPHHEGERAIPRGKFETTGVIRAQIRPICLECSYKKCVDCGTTIDRGCHATRCRPCRLARRRAQGEQGYVKRFGEKIKDREARLRKQAEAEEAAIAAMKQGVPVMPRIVRGHYFPADWYK